ncbi:MAG: helix-turn-helix domain-containing protein, partial [Gammaproteobacteria bacterium]
DLYYRLNVFPINMPPLRERKDDIAPIGKYLLARAARAGNCICPDITDDAMQMLQAYHWPGNVRELDNVMQRALILQSSRVITRKDIQFENNEIQRQVAVQVVPACDENQDSLGSDLKAREEEMIIDALEESLGSRKYAAEKLGISPRTLRYKLARMRKQGIAIPAG